MRVGLFRVPSLARVNTSEYVTILNGFHIGYRQIII